MNKPTTFCVVHDREWTGSPTETCPWCEIAALQPSGEPDSYIGWTVLDVDDSGGVLLQSPTGKRHRVWFQVAEIERLQAEVQQLRTSDVFGNDELLD
jgi:hypothetical protein